MPGEIVLNVVDVLRIPGRADQAVVVEALSGSLRDLAGGVFVSDSGDRWRMTAVATSPPGAERLIVGLQRIGAGPDLEAGARLALERDIKPADR